MSTLSPLADCRGREGRHFCHTHATPGQMEGPVLTFLCHQDQLTHAPENRFNSSVLPSCGVGPRFPKFCSCLRTGSVFIKVASTEGWDQLCTALISQHLEVSGVNDITIDRACNRAMNPEMCPCCSPGPNNTIDLVSIKITTTCFSLFPPLHRI